MNYSLPSVLTDGLKWGIPANTDESRSDFTKSNEEMGAYEAREKALMDEAAKDAHARKEGIEEGKIQLIRGMSKNGMPIEDIAKFTNLRIEEIRNILQV